MAEREPPDVLAELNAVAEWLEKLPPTLWQYDYQQISNALSGKSARLRAVAAQIAERERHAAEAVREMAADVAKDARVAASKFIIGTESITAEEIELAIRALDLSPILNPEKSSG